MQRVYSEFRLIFSRELQVDLFFRLYGCETLADETSSDGGASVPVGRMPAPANPGGQGALRHQPGDTVGSDHTQRGGEGETGVADRRAERVVSAGRVGWNPLRAHPAVRPGDARDAAIYNHAETRAFLGTSWGIRARSTHYWD